MFSNIIIAQDIESSGDSDEVMTGGWGAEQAPTVCPETVDDWNKLRDNLSSGNTFQFINSSVINKDGEKFNAIGSFGMMGGGFGMMGGGFNQDEPKEINGIKVSKTPSQDKINFCLDSGSLKTDEKKQVVKCMEKVLNLKPLINPEDTKNYYEANKPIFEKSNTMTADGKTPKITFRDPIMNNPELYRNIDNPKTRPKAISDLRAKVKKLGGDVFYDESAIGGGGFGRVEVMIPGKDGCDRHYSIQTDAPNSKSEFPSTIKRLPVATICMKDPFTGEKLEKPAGFLMFYERVFAQPGEKVSDISANFGMGQSNYTEEGIFPSQDFQTQHSGATNCKSCHITPYLPFVGDPEKLPAADKDGFKNIKKHTNSEYSIQTWGMVREENGKKYIDEFFSNLDRGPVYGATDSMNRDQVLDHCLEGKQDLREKMKKAMNCQQCHNGSDREILTDGDMMSGGISTTTYAKYILGEGMYSKHAMPPENNFTIDERRILVACLDSEFRGVTNFETGERTVEGNLHNWKKSVPCEIPLKVTGESDHCPDCPPKLKINEEITESNILKINQISTNEGMVYVLDKDNSGADPEGNFGEMNLNLTELHDKEGNTIGFKRSVFSGICTKFCNPSEFDVLTDKDGNFTGVKPSGVNGLQMYGHEKMTEEQVIILNKFIKEKLVDAKKDGGLEIKELIDELGHEKISDSHKVDAVTGATYIEKDKKKFLIPKELKGGFNTVATALLYAYDSQIEVGKLKRD